MHHVASSINTKMKLIIGLKKERSTLTNHRKVFLNSACRLYFALTYHTRHKSWKSSWGSRSLLLKFAKSNQLLIKLSHQSSLMPGPNHLSSPKQLAIFTTEMTNGYHFTDVISASPKCSMKQYRPIAILFMLVVPPFKSHFKACILAHIA